MSVAWARVAHMFEGDVSRSPVTGAGRPALDADTLAGWVRDLTRVGGEMDDAGRVDLIRGLEEVKAAAAGAQAVLTAELDASQRRAQEATGARPREVGKGVAAQVGLARRESPHRGRIHLGLAQALCGEMPHTLAALRAGKVSEWRATLLVKENACCTRQDRAVIDRTIAGDADRLATLSDQQLVAEARGLAYRLDPHALVERHARARADRSVTLRPAPDTMTYLTALLPVEQGVAAYAALTRAADALRSAGDDRTRGQAMADTLVERTTGQESATAVGVDVRVVITDRSLFAGDHEPALLEGYGTVPATWARDLVADATDGLRAWFHRLYTAPGTGDLVALDSRSRTAPAGLASFIRTRDQRCRTPWCDAPLRHIDHIKAHAQDGPTQAANLDGLCEACNHAKTAPGWRARPRPGPQHTIETTTPTGHTHHSQAPPLPGSNDGHPSRADIAITRLRLALAV